MTAMAALAVLLSYLAGSVSFPYWIARLRGVDLRTVGSHKLGGSNLWKSVGRGEAIVGGLLDAAKGFVAVEVARAVGLPLEVQLGCGIAAIVGQMWPVFHGLDGGRANSAGWGFALAVDPVAFLIMMLPVLAAIAMRLAVRRQRIDEARRTLDRAIARAVPLRRQRAVSAQRRLAALSPLAVLGRGYAIVEGTDGHIRASVATLKTGERVRVRMRDGRAGALVETVERNG